MKRVIFLLLIIIHGVEAYAQNPAVPYEQIALDYLLCNYNSFNYDTAYHLRYHDTLIIRKCWKLQQDNIRIYLRSEDLRAAGEYTQENAEWNARTTDPKLKIPSKSDGLVIAKSGNHKAVFISHRFYYGKYSSLMIYIRAYEFLATNLIFLFNEEGRLIKVRSTQSFY